MVSSEVADCTARVYIILTVLAHESATRSNRKTAHDKLLSAWIRLGSSSESGVLDCSSVLPPQENTAAETVVALAARQILFRKTNGSWAEFLTLGTDEQVLTDPVIAASWLALCLVSKSAARILVYSYAKSAKPILRIEIRIEGTCNPSVRFDGPLLTIADDLGHLRAYELTYGEQIRDLTI